jgi:hypothetical protein
MRTVLAAGFVIALAGISTAGERGGRPLAFEANRGQTDAHVEFLARGRGYTAFLTATEAVLRLDGGATVRLRPVGADRARIVGDDELPGGVHYYRDASSTRVSAPTYRRVRYVDVYPGIDLVYYGRPRRLEYDFVVAPGADPGRIALAFDGVERLDVDEAGDLVAHTAVGDLRQPRPVVYQESEGARRAVDADYVVDADGRVRFRLGSYDPSRPLVIDPVVAYSTYLGGTWDDADEPFEGIEGIALDAAGNVYVTGTTQSPDFPTTAGADRTLGGGGDVFVTKFSPSGAVVYSTLLGGDCDDTARDIAVDAAGNAYVTGRWNGGSCYAEGGVLVAKLDPAGAVVYASFFGGRLADSSIGQAIAVDAEGHAYVTGAANSDTHDFPTTPGAYRTVECENVYPFAGDVFVAKLSADGTTLLYSTIICGDGDESANGIAIDAAGNAYVAGTTASSDFPTVNAFQTMRRGGSVDVTGFVAKLSPDGSRLVYSTYLGGSGSDAIGGIAVDAQGNAYVTGETGSDDFPTTPGVLQEHPGNRHCIEGCTDAFVTKIAPSGSSLAYSTYLYGELDDAGSRIAVDSGGNAYVVGTTYSAYFPVVNAFQALNRGLDDAFIAKLSPDGTRLVYSSYLGGSGPGPSPSTGADDGDSIALDAAGNAYVVGYTLSVDFPTTPDAFQPHLGAGVCDFLGTQCGDVFVAKITAGGPGVVPPVSVTVTPAAVAPGATVTATWAGVPRAGADNHMRLYTLGSPDGYPGEILAWWPTTGAAAGTEALALPDGLAPGWYELRLYSSDPEYPSLPQMVARSEPIRVDGQGSTTTTLPPGSSCDVACDDGDPCTVDECVAAGCVSTPASGFASVTCTCRRERPAACAGQRLPGSIDRACGLFDDAAGTPDTAQAARRLRKGLRALKESIAKSRKSGVSRDCVRALKAELRDAKERVGRVLGRR